MQDLNPTHTDPESESKSGHSVAHSTGNVTSLNVTGLDDLNPIEIENSRRIVNARLPGHEGLYSVMLSDQGALISVERSPALPASPTSPAADCLDVNGDWLSPGGVDLQINGALGLAFPDLDNHDVASLLEICRFLGRQGIDGFLPTLVTTAIANIHRALSVIAKVQHQIQQESFPGVAQIWGVHLEGPCLNREKRGAHPDEHLQPLTLDGIKNVLGDHAHCVTVMTLAPELDPTGTVIPYLRSLGIVVSLGHSQATVEQAEAAFSRGATMVTHAFNAMPSLHHRKPGMLGAALVHPNVACGLIADGQHVCPTMLELLVRAGRGDRTNNSSESRYPQGLFLVSDALSPLGLPDGTYPWDTRQIQVKNGTAQLEDGTLAGTTHPLLVGVQNLVKWGICDVGEAIALATLAPRRALGLPPFPMYLPDMSSDTRSSAASLALKRSRHSSQWLRWSLNPQTQALEWTPL